MNEKEKIVAIGDILKMSYTALEELQSVFTSMEQKYVELICGELLKARRIAFYGVGREGLMMKAFCMRMMHLGLDVHMVGDMTTPPVGAGDLLFVSAGPGNFSTVSALMNVAKKAHTRIMVITAQPGGKAPQKADAVIYLPAQTMANDLNNPTSLLPMGSLYEISQLIFFDLISIIIREKIGQSPEQMRSRHTNLE